MVGMVQGWHRMTADSGCQVPMEEATSLTCSFRSSSNRAEEVLVQRWMPRRSRCRQSVVSSTVIRMLQLPRASQAASCPITTSRPSSIAGSTRVRSRPGRQFTGVGAVGPRLDRHQVTVERPFRGWNLGPHSPQHPSSDSFRAQRIEAAHHNGAITGRRTRARFPRANGHR